VENSPVSGSLSRTDEQVSDIVPGINRFPSVSVIIPTKNRPSDLALAVESVIRQTVPPQQLLIVDQSEDGESRRRVQERIFGETELRDRTKLCYIHDAAISGGAVARNRAMEIARGDIWVFLDDDVILEPGFLEELLQVYVQYPQATGVSGIITNYRRPPLTFRAWTYIFVRGPFRDERQPIYWNANRLRQAEPIPVMKFGGGLMSFRARAIQGLLFDANLRGVSDGEDVDFCSRLQPGARLLLTPRARLVHKQSPVGRLQDHWLRRSVRSTFYLYAKNWRRGVKNRLCFAWLATGYGLVATFSGLRRCSLDPWKAFFAGLEEARQLSRQTCRDAN